MKEFTLKIRQGRGEHPITHVEEDIFFVSSDDIPGLFLCGRTLSHALFDVELAKIALEKINGTAA